MDAGWYGPEMKMSSDATTVSPDKDLDIRPAASDNTVIILLVFTPFSVT